MKPVHFAAESGAHVAPEAYRTVRDVQGAFTPPRWFRGDLTAWAIHVSIFRWQLIEWQRIAGEKSA